MLTSKTHINFNALIYGRGHHSHSQKEQDKIDSIIDMVQQAFDKEKNNFVKPTWGFFGNPKHPDSFTDRLNDIRRNDYLYPRLLKRLLDNHVRKSEPSVRNDSI